MEGAETLNNNSVTINPQRGFRFWVALSRGLMESPDVMDETKANLERVAHITSLKDYFDGLRELHGSLDEFFSRDYLIRCYPLHAQQYHPSSLDI